MPTIQLFIVHHVVQIKSLYEFILCNSIATRGFIPLANKHCRPRTTTPLPLPQGPIKQSVLLSFNFLKRISLLVGWLVVLRIYVASAVFQPYRDLEVGDNQSLKIQVAKPAIEPRSSCSASQELNHSATAAPLVCSI